jgi:hypothetical protein
MIPTREANMMSMGGNGDMGGNGLSIPYNILEKEKDYADELKAKYDA